MNEEEFEDNELEDEDEMWECYNCGLDNSVENPPSGFLANYHPICLNCANDIYFDAESPDRFRLSYHAEFGNLFFYKGQLLIAKNKNEN